MYRTWLFFMLLVGLFSEGVKSQGQSEPSVSITPPVSNPFNTTPSTSSFFTTAPPTSNIFTMTPPTSDPATTTSPASSIFTTAPPTFDLYTTIPPTSDPPTTTSATSRFFNTGPPTFDPFTTTPPTSDPPTNTSPTSRFFTTAPPTFEVFPTTPPTSAPPSTTSPTSRFFTTAPPTFEVFPTTPPTSAPPTTTSPTSIFFTTAPPIILEGFPTTPPTSAPPTTTSPTSIFFTIAPPTILEVFPTTPPTSAPPTTTSPTSNFFTTAPPTSDLFTRTPPTSAPPTTTSPTSRFFTTAFPTFDLFTTTPPTSNLPTTTSPTSNFFTTAPLTSDLFTTAPPMSDSPTSTSPTSRFFTTAPPTSDLFTTTPPRSNPPSTTSASSSFTTATPAQDLSTNTSPDSNSHTSTSQLTSSTPTTTYPTNTSIPSTTYPTTTRTPNTTYPTTTRTPNTTYPTTTRTPNTTYPTTTRTPNTTYPTTTSSPINTTMYKNFTGSSSTSLPMVSSGTDQLVIAWTPALGNVDYYVVFLGNVSQRVTSPTATFSALPPGTGYDVTVQAVSGNFTRIIAIMMVATYPTPPGNIKPSIGRDAITLVWDSPANMNNVKKSFNITVTRIGLYRSGSSIYTSESTNVTIRGLTPGNYSFTIVTVGALQYTSTPKTVSIQLLNSPSPIDDHVGVIVGAVVGSVGGLIVICLLGFLIWKIVRRRKLSLDKRQSKDPPAKAEEFAEIIKMKERRDTQGFGTEFSALQCVGALQSRSISTHPKNATKNHPNAVFPYDNSLVKLSEDGNSSNGYINASYIPGQKFKKEFIAAQSPLHGTVNDFWQMIWEQHITTIVMFSSCEEDAPASSEVYWPLTKSKLFGNVLVTHVEEKPSVECIFRKFELTHVKKKDSFQVKQFQYDSRPVNSDLCEQEPLINFVTHVVQQREQHPIKYPTLVHCRTGGSRCGIFIALSRIVTQLKMNNSVDVYSIVNDLFLSRPSMIQTKDEYLFLHHCTLDIIRARDQRNRDMGYTDPGGNNIYYNESAGNNIYYNDSADQRYDTVLKRYNSIATDYETIYDSTID